MYVLARTNTKAMRPPVTCRPWNPVVRKNTDPYGVDEIVTPSWTSLAYSVTWPAMKTAPIRYVRMNHSRMPQLRGFAADPVRPTLPCSAAKTPSWQVTEDSTRIVVLTLANGTFRNSVEVFHSVSVPGAAAAVVTDLIVKYAANRAAKNISSLESQTIVPTLTILGRSACPCSRDAGSAVAVATRSLCRSSYQLTRPPPCMSATNPFYCGNVLPLHAGPGDQIPPFTPLRLLTGWSFEPVLLGVIAVLAGLYLYGVHKLHARGDKWPRGRTFAFVVLKLKNTIIAT